MCLIKLGNKYLVQSLKILSNFRKKCGNVEFWFLISSEKLIIIPPSAWQKLIKNTFSLIAAIPVVTILAAIPWLLPWREINVPYLPTFHVIASISPWIGSTLYHLFMNHNTGYIAYKVLLLVDMLGIWVTQTAGTCVLCIFVQTCAA